MTITTARATAAPLPSLPRSSGAVSGRRNPAPTRSAAPRPAPGGPGAARPRLLLPPVVDPEPRRPEAVRYVPPAVRSVAGSPVTDARREVWTRVEDVAPRAAELPDPAAACGVVALAAVEMLAGRRSPAQLLRWVTPELYDRLVLHAAVTVGAGGRAHGRAVRLLSTRACRVGEHAAEASVVLHDGERVRAAAVRVEEHRGRWRATVLEIG